MGTVYGIKESQGKQQEKTLRYCSKTIQNFIADIGLLAGENWIRKQICLPSLTVAIILEGMDSHRTPGRKQWNKLFPHWKEWDGAHCFSLGQAIALHNDYLAFWQAGDQTKPNWDRLAGEKNYIRAVQFLQDAEYPYCQDKNYETLLVNKIENYDLEKLDQEYSVL